jgi:hypothetical protein
VPPTPTRSSSRSATPRREPRPRSLQDSRDRPACVRGPRACVGARTIADADARSLGPCGSSSRGSSGCRSPRSRR